MMVQSVVDFFLETPPSEKKVSFVTTFVFLGKKFPCYEVDKNYSIQTGEQIL